MAQLTRNGQNARLKDGGAEREKEFKMLVGAKSWQHTGFPSGPPPQYSLCLKPLNFRVRMGSGAYGLVWPPAKTHSCIILKYRLSADLSERKMQFSFQSFL